MKLYHSIGPNPAVVDLFLAEKGLEIERVEVDLRGGENRRPEYLKINPAGQLPALVLDGGEVITEVTAICEYLEEEHREPPLIGSTPTERAETRMWTRRIDLGIVEPMANGFRFSEGLKLFENRMRCLPEAADGLKACSRDKQQWLDGQLGEHGGPWICGERFTLADIFLFSFLEFGARVGQPLDEQLEHLVGWRERMRARPTVQAG